MYYKVDSRINRKYTWNKTLSYDHLLLRKTIFKICELRIRFCLSGFINMNVYSAYNGSIEEVAAVEKLTAHNTFKIVY